MGQHSCCNQQKVKRGLWSPEEDEKLIRYITTHGYGCWSEVPEKADNEIKNYWNSWIKKKTRKPSAPPTNTAPSSTDQQSHIIYASNQLELVNQDLRTTMAVPSQETLFSSPGSGPLFMFDTAPILYGIQDAYERGELFLESVNLNTETWNLSQIQFQAFPPSTSFTAVTDTDSCLPPLAENMENMVPIEVQACTSTDEEREMALESLQRQQQELNESAESQQCSSFLFWDNIEGQLGGVATAPPSSNMGTTVSSFPSSL